MHNFTKISDLEITREVAEMFLVDESNVVVVVRKSGS